MSLLVDSNALLWLLRDPGKLTRRAQDTLMERGVSRFFSAASVWELEIKRSKGKLDLPPTWLGTVQDLGLKELKITSADCVSSARLPHHHSDPFDRMIVTHAHSHGLKLVTRDTFLAIYGIPIIVA